MIFNFFKNNFKLRQFIELSSMISIFLSGTSNSCRISEKERSYYIPLKEELTNLLILDFEEHL